MEKFANPADSLMKILAISYPKKEEDEKKINDLVYEYTSITEPKMLAEREAISFADF